MNIVKKQKLAAGILMTMGLCGFSSAQMIPEDQEETIYELSPFEVNTSNDRGYYAANTVSGSRINTALQDMPMPIEVITSEFIEDTGSNDLRESLRYSAGILLESQNDATTGNSAGTALNGVPGGVHNGSGATSNITNTTIKMRGFLTESSLRKGFRRQHGSDAINIDRVEVVRGPAALLYGIGNFGGIVNYLPKRPLDIEKTSITALAGDHNQYRATIDTTAPVNQQIGYRVTAAVDRADHWTDVQNSNSWFISPVLVYRPDDRTKITLDLEIGSETTHGIGFQAMRARGDLEQFNQIVNQQGRLQKAGFAVFDGIDNRTYRLSGPDTFVKTNANNMLFEVEHHLMEGLDFIAGYNRAVSKLEMRDIVNNAYMAGVGPKNLRGTIKVEPFEIANGDPIYDSEIYNGSTDDRVLNNASLIYMWNRQTTRSIRDEVKVELNANKTFFEDNYWLGQSHMLLLGVSDLKAKNDSRTYISGGGTQDAFLYKNPADHSLIRYGSGIQDDGTDTGISRFSPLLQTAQSNNTAYNQGYYAVWQGRFLNDRVTAIYGARRDRNDQRLLSWNFANGVSTNETFLDPEPQSETTSQIGVSVELVDGLSVFALKSDGLQPDFNGLRDGMGQPIGSTMAKSEEIGVKLNLLEGRIAATMSAYKINVAGASSLRLWWTPAPAKGRYDPTKPTIYNITNVIATNNAHADNIDAYNAAVAAGDVIEQNGLTYITVLDGNGNDTVGATYLDGIFEWAATHTWPGWLFATSEVAGGIGNNASQDWSSATGNSFQADFVGEQESKGYELQFLFSLTDNWQLILNYANTEREIISQGKFPRYPYPQDRWAIWYFPDGNWGLQGVSREDAYGDPTDTSTWTGGPASTRGESMDDTPKHELSFWTSYKFSDGKLEGLKLGFGGNYQSEREYLSGFSFQGDAITNQYGQRVHLYTDTKLILNAMARYDFDWKGHEAFCQLNIDNLTNDKKLYGYVYEPGMSWRFQLGLTF